MARKNRSRKVYNEIFQKICNTHGGNPAEDLAAAICMACEYYGIPKRDFADVWIDFLQGKR